MKKTTYRPARSQQAYPPDLELQIDFDYTAPYPCQVCKRSFRSRHLLATHPHQKSEPVK